MSSCVSVRVVRSPRGLPRPRGKFDEIAREVRLGGHVHHHGRRGVVMVVPEVLFRMSRTEFVSKLAVVAGLAVCTLTYEKKKTAKTRRSARSLREKLDRARSGRSTVFTTPVAVKCIFLEFLELVRAMPVAAMAELRPMGSAGGEEGHANGGSPL